jgi:DNA polymerase (family 10)
MSTNNATVADLLRRYAAVLAMQGADRFKLKAYRRAAETVEALHTDVGTLIKSGSDLQDLPGIGKAISDIIQEIVQHGSLKRLDQTSQKLAPELVELATRPRLDATKVSRIYKKLGIQSLRELSQALVAGTIGDVFGSRMEFHVRQGLDDRPRHLLWSIRNFAAQFEDYLRSLPGVTKAAAVGSLRRRQETVGDLNYLVGGKSASAIFKQVAEFGAVKSVRTKGRTARDFVLSSGIVLSLVWCPAKEWGLVLILATGSSSHLRELKAHAAKCKVTLTPAGLSKKRIEAADEGKVYHGLKLQFIEPEIREGRGEVAAAADNQLPPLIEQNDLRGDLHMHTTASDGANSIAEMVAAAQVRGYEYIAITDHSQSLKITNGLTEARLRQHLRAIDKLNAKLKGFRILKSAEVDILEDGKLDYSNSMLKQLDFTICSIHSRFSLNKQQQTERIMRAMDNPYFTILGHATGRLLLKREGYELDIERILDHARATGCHVEINSSPDRLDLSDEHALLAKERGIKIAINTDAHAVAELDFISAGINQARRAWLTAGDVLNTLPLDKLFKALAR